MGIEQKINQKLNEHPVIKKKIKREYQKIMYFFSKKVKSSGEIVRISPDDPEHEYFFGYYDKSPWDATDRFVLCMRAKDTWSDVSPKEKADILLIDTTKAENDPQRIRKIAETRAWNVQQSCMLQWLGPDFGSRVLYNDYRDGRYCSIILTLETMKEQVISAPVYTVAADGTFALTLDFSRLYNLRPGYGYYNVPETTKGEALPDATAVWKVDLKSGEVTDLLTYKDFAQFQPRIEMQEEGSIHKVNHLMLNPNGKRFMVLYRWFSGQRKYTRLITCNTDGTDMYVLSDDDMVSHCFWKNNSVILAFENKKKTGPGYYLMKDKTQKYIHCWPQFSNDGHPSYSPDGKHIVTDSYPDRARVASINLMNGDERKRDNITIARVFAPFKYDNDTRCDLHPRWNHVGDKICFDSAFEGHRGMYMLNIKKECKVLDKDKKNIVFVVTACKKSGPIEQMLNIITYLNRQEFTPILITLYEEPKDGTSQLERYLDLGVVHYRVPLRKKDIILGRTKILKKKLDELKPDIIHSLGVFPDYAISSMRYPGHVITLRNFIFEDYPIKFGKIKGMILAKLHIWAMKRTDQTWTCSESLSNQYRYELKLDYPFIRNGVNTSKFIKVTKEEKRTLKEKLNFSFNKPILVYAGQFVERKNQKFLLELFDEYRELDNTILLLLGEGTEFVELKDNFSHLPNVLFAGNVNNVSYYLQASDIYISSSKSEGLPNGVLEAMATGLPVILSDIEQHKEIYNCNPKIGLLYKSGDKQDCVKKICKLISQRYEEAGLEAYKCANNQFSAEKMSKKYQEEYKRLINERK